MRLATLLLTLLALLLCGCGESDTPAATSVSVTHASPEVAEAVSVLVAGTGIPVKHAPAGDVVDLNVRVDKLSPDGWSDIGSFAADAVEPAAEQLMEAFPQHADRISSNRDAYVEKLVSLDGYARRAVQLVPAENRKIESTHNQLQAFADAYGYDFVLAPSATNLDKDLLFDKELPVGSFETTYLGKMDQTITAVATHLGAAGLDTHGSTGQLTYGHDHAH